MAVLNIQQTAVGFAAVLLAMAALSLFGVALNQRGYTSLVAGCLTGLIFLATVYTIIDGNGLYDTGVLAFPIIITMASFFFRRTGVLISVTLVCGGVVGLALAGARGLIGGSLARPVPVDHLTIMVILLIAFGALIDVVSAAWGSSLLAVKDSKAQLEMAFASAGMGVWDWDILGDHLNVDEQMAVGFGWPPGSAHSIGAWLSRLHFEDREHTRASLDSYLEQGTGVWSGEYRMPGVEGEWRWRLAAGQISEWDGHGHPLRMLGVVLDITEIKQAQLALLESERRYRLLAQELHDSVTQTIYSMSLTLKAASRLLHADPARLEGLIQQLSDMSADALAQMRAMLNQTRPRALDERGFVAAIQDHIAGLSDRSNLKVSFEVRGEGGLSRDAELALYRVAQEALNNVARHGGVERAQVRLVLGPDTATLTVEDRGAGFDPDAVAGRSGSFGLGNMRERVESLGGQFHLETAPGSGTRLWAEIPRRASREPVHE